MKTAIMGGAYTNSGDFLIEQRSIELIEAITGSDVDILKRNISYDDKIDILNDYDLIVFAGGPIFQPHIYPRRIPFVREIDKINTPIRLLGGGWKGLSDSAKVVYQKYNFTSTMISFIHALEKQYPLGCRDWYTMRTLQKSNVTNLTMTGCPAWYDLSKIDSLTLHPKYNESTITDDVTIGISEPALPRNKPYFYTLINLMLRMYPNADIKLFFHGGIHAEDLTRIDSLCRNHSKLTYIDMSGSSDDFKQYDPCFLHIGFRVHAHIYNLSQGNVSILINEDARGSGVNHALGLENINCLVGNTRIYKPQISRQIFEALILDYIKYMEQTGYAQYRHAYHQIQNSFKVIRNFIANMI